MNRKIVRRNLNIVLAAVMFAALLAACTTPLPQTGVDPAAQAATQQAQIVQAVQATATAAAMQQEIDRLQTQVAAASQTPQVIVVTATPEPPTATVPATETVAAPTATLVPPTATQVPATATLVPPTATATNRPPTVTPTALACNLAKFEADVTIPDGTQLAPGTSFTKTWRIKNAGACTWTTSYDVVFVSGDSLGAATVVDLPGSVAPGQVIDISIPMKAPNADGSYRGNWKLRDAGGLLFGLGNSGATFYVDIRVKGAQAGLPYNMVANYCSAAWHSAAGRLDCPGKDSDSRGFVMKLDKPTLESGYVDDEAALYMHPQMITDGVIRGFYPALRIENGAHFRAAIGCARGATKCNVKFILEYQVGSDAFKPLATWSEVYDEKFQQVDVDLSSLAGKDVRLILTVFANGASDQDRALWLAPRVEK